MTRNIFSVVLVIVGVCVAAPIVVSYATAWWWLSAPLIIVYVFVLWRWGLAWLTDDDTVADASVLEKILSVLIALVWTFIGVALAVYLAMLAVENWMLLVLALLVVAAFGLWGWLAIRSDDAKKRAAAAAATLPIPTLNDPPKPTDLVR